MTPRRKQLFRHLCRDVRIVSEAQASGVMAIGGPGPADVRRELAGLVIKDFLRRDRVIARVLPPLTEPIARWSPGEPPPDFGALAWRLEKRWDVPPQVLPVYRAGPGARRVYGSGTCSGGLNFAALSHDLACADMLIAFAARYPERLPHWVGEDVRKDGLARGEKLPDVILFDDNLKPYLVCEMAGSYPKVRLEAFHTYASVVLNLPYELW